MGPGGSPCFSPVLHSVREAWGRCGVCEPSRSQGGGAGGSGDVPHSARAPAGSRRHCDRSFTLWHLLGAGRRRANLGLGKVDEELSTVTKENKPHSLTVTLH